MVVQILSVPATGRIIGLMVLSGLVLAGIALQRRLQSRVLLSQPTPRAGLVGSLGVVEAITAFGLAATLALLASALITLRVAPSEALMAAAEAYSIVRLVADSGGTVLAITCIILAGVAYSNRRSAYLWLLDQARIEYLSSLKQRIAFTRIRTRDDDDDPTRTLRETIRRLEEAFLNLLRWKPQAIEELNALYDALTKATEELVAHELERRTSHVDLYGEEILNGPQDCRHGYLGYLWRSGFGSRHLMRAFGAPGRILFASGLSYVFVFVLVVSFDPVRPPSETSVNEVALGTPKLRTSSWTSDLARWPSVMADVVPTTTPAVQVAPPSVQALPEVPSIESHNQPSGTLAAETLQSDAPTRRHPVGLSRVHQALVAKDSLAISRWLLEMGWVSEARQKLRRLAESGDHDAALALGATYDPLAIDDRGSKNYNPDPRRALYWYRKAHQLDR